MLSGVDTLSAQAIPHHERSRKIKGMTERTNIYFDFEFIDDGQTIVPISIGMCTDAIALTETAPSVVQGWREAGDLVKFDFYQEYAFDPARANNWVREHVFPHLDAHRCPSWVGSGESRAVIARQIKEWISDVCGNTQPRFWGYYPSYDWVCMCQHFGSMTQGPEGWPIRPECLMQLADQMGVNKSKFPGQEKEHHALADAKWNRDLHRMLKDKKDE